MYKKAFELSYKNKKVEIEIQDFTGTVRNINGTEDLFSLSYISDSKDKGQSILVTEADINFYADDYFNIDELKTVGETDIKVKYYEDDALLWSGFVIPDFFSTSVDIAPVVSMVATDRIGTLKEISNNAESNIPIQILASCLKQTGQDLPINLIIGNNHFETPIQLERIDEIASYDVMRTFMVLFNCKITLYKNAWWIINKKLLESGFVNYKSYNSNGVGGSVTPFAQPILDIDLVDRDGQREIKPTASEISLFLEFGGSKKYPDNWNFEKWNGSSFNDWTARNGFIPAIKQSEEDKALWLKMQSAPNWGYVDNYFNSPKLESTASPIEFIDGKSDIKLIMNFTTKSDNRISILPIIKVPNRNPSQHKYFTIEKDGNLRDAGQGTITIKSPPLYILPSETDTPKVIQTEWSQSITVLQERLGLTRGGGAEIILYIFRDILLPYETPATEDAYIHSISVSFNDSETTGKGLIFKTKQGGEKFSKSRDPETILFSDKINQGVNGYFYNYKYDDTSIVDLPSEFALSSVRERADMFSKARDFYSLDGDFIVNPLARYKCGSKSFVLIGGQNRREDASIVIEEIVSNTLNRTDYIYTYFDDGKDKVKSIGTASGGSSSSGGGGGVSSPQLWKVDEDGNIYTEYNAYSLKNLSAFGFEEEQGGGGVIVDLTNYYTKVEVDSLIDNIEVGDVDLTNYYTKVEVDSLIDNIEVGDVDLTNYYTKVEVDSLIDNIEVGDVDLTNYYTKVEVDSLIPDLSNYYTKVETYSKTEVDNLINGVGVGGGGGLIKEDSEGNYYSQNNFYSLGGLSAFGFSEVGDGTGGGGIINVIDNLTSTSKTDPLSANQGRYLKTLIDNIEVGEGGQVIVDWGAITGKPDTFVPSAHTHTFESLTSIPTTLAGYGITDATSLSVFNLHANNKANPHEVTKAQIGLGNVENLSVAAMFSYANLTEETTIQEAYINYASIDSLQANNGINLQSWKLQQVGTELHFIYNGVVKQIMLSDGSFVATGGITAFY